MLMFVFLPLNKILITWWQYRNRSWWLWGCLFPIFWISVCSSVVGGRPLFLCRGGVWLFM